MPHLNLCKEQQIISTNTYITYFTQIFCSFLNCIFSSVHLYFLACHIPPLSISHSLACTNCRLLTKCTSDGLYVPCTQTKQCTMQLYNAQGFGHYNKLAHSQCTLYKEMDPAHEHYAIQSVYFCASFTLLCVCYLSECDIRSPPMTNVYLTKKSCCRTHCKKGKVQIRENKNANLR